ncbi:hypothetical protein [Bacillus sp. JCM 19034]|uniref:hypothetical protein n=1 Tax=Bacillus sp. JCM 19034 TaxID=1481928 RepID=UPI000781A7C3|nr:hypothetical protein [Bacillus sp. JCM 19034]
MEIFLTLIVVFIISFLLIFKFVYSGNKKETEEEKMNFFMVIFVSVALSLIITATIGLVIFALLGSTSIVNRIFSLNISKNQLAVITISFFVYLFTLDSFIEITVKYIIGKNIFYVIVLLFIRIGIFYLIGKIISLNQTISITIAIGVALIILLIETLYYLRERNKEKDIKGK